MRHEVNTACRCGMSALLLVGLVGCGCVSIFANKHTHISYSIHTVSPHPNPSSLPYRRLGLCVASGQLVA